MADARGNREHAEEHWDTQDHDPAQRVAEARAGDRGRKDCRRIEVGGAGNDSRKRLRGAAAQRPRSRVAPFLPSLCQMKDSHPKF